MAGAMSNADFESESSCEEIMTVTLVGTTSQTSTELYKAHEAFRTFKNKIPYLSSFLGATEITNIQRIAGGSYNRMIAADIRKKDHSGNIEAVFRIPRKPHNLEAVNLSEQTSTSTASTKAQDSSDAVVGQPRSRGNIFRDGKKSGPGLKQLWKRVKRLPMPLCCNKTTVNVKMVSSPLPLDSRILDQIATHQMLSARGLPVPEVLAYDSSSSNALKTTYTVLSRVPGIRLYALYNEMSTEERLNIVDEVVPILAHMKSIRFTYAGRISHSEIKDSSRPLQPPDMERLNGVETILSCFGVDPGQPATTDSDSLTQSPKPKRTLIFSVLRDIMSNQLSASAAYHKDRNPMKYDSFSELLEIFDEMCTLGYLEFPAMNVLFHPDLEPRNILVAPSISERTSTGAPKPTISAVVDWDNTLFLPLVLTMEPPIWLWDHSPHMSLEEFNLPYWMENNADLLPPHWYTDRDARMNTTCKQVKSRFETLFVEAMNEVLQSGDFSSINSSSEGSVSEPEKVEAADGLLFTREMYEDMAYGRGRWLRRLWRFAKDGFYSHTDIYKFDQFKEHWEKEKDRWAGGVI
ncbi:hypothetical protein K402DRAFT_452709 [Aulographum hederae CBS 113979]|uniref:Aminoglycoside phosphotransferase domain-containing protein n=1 Tax=Aulographum hederae CBS 113979 TaxID=1176131 RepID=A0A6G1H5N2_9PEZI|nr:hypothetical protein K402DRAFT_452709 [Aulographum hederae CBS 113979]